MWLVDLILPRRCVSCGGPSQALCSSCLALLRPIRAPRCARCGAPTAWPVERCLECSGRRLAFASASAAVAYSGPARPFVRAWKERGLRHLGTLAAEVVVAQFDPPSADVIAYIPPDPVRQLERSRHPAESLARELGRLWGIESEPLLRRTRSVPRQAALRLAGRRGNLRGAFESTSAPRRVLLVDDVYTTGSTANAAATALRAAGAARIDVVTFARAIRQ